MNFANTGLHVEDQNHSGLIRLILCIIQQKIFSQSFSAAESHTVDNGETEYSVPI